MKLIEIFNAFSNEKIIEISSEFYKYKVFYDLGVNQFICMDGFDRTHTYSDTNLLNLLNATINRDDTTISVVE